jgi:hypothetical protein
VLGALGVVAPYAAMRAARVPRAAAAGATLIAMALPWSAWLGVATVPDGWTGALIAAGAIAQREDRARPWAAAALFVASLSRYEAWPACAVLALFCALRIAGDLPAPARRREAACAIVALVGPALWMAWNAHAHGSAFHFVARVTAFRRSVGAADVPWSSKLLGYPRALLDETPEAAALGACGVIALVWREELRRRWRWAAATALAIVLFLVVGDLGDGAPTHHPARALGPVWWIFIGMGVDSLRVAVSATGAPRRMSASGAPRRVSAIGAVAVALAAVAWVASLPSRWAAAPGLGELERRDAQIARGLELRTQGAESAEITPCQFEHFALIAAWGEPERARVQPRTREPLTSDCPRVTTP